MRALRAIVGTVATSVVLLALPTLGGGELPPAGADPDSNVVEVVSATPPASPPLIGWPQLGLPDRLDLLGANQPTETAIPVPAGTAPTVLSGMIGAIVNVMNGRVDVLDDRGMVLGSIPVPPDASTIPFQLDISPGARQQRDGQAEFCDSRRQPECQQLHADTGTFDQSARQFVLRAAD